MASQTRQIPEGYHTVTPYLVVRDAARAIDFYKKAFGAENYFAWKVLRERSATRSLKLVIP